MRRPARRMASMWSWMVLWASAVITGPTSVESLSGLPTSSSAMAALSMVSTRSATSSCRQSTRSAEQRWPAESKAEAKTSATTCSGSAEESTISAFWPPVSAMNGTGRPSGLSRPASCRWISRATSVEPVNTTPQVRGSPTSFAPTSPAPGRNCKRSGRNAGLAQQLHGPEGDQRRFLGRLGQHRIAGRERRRDLAREDGERESSTG